MGEALGVAECHQRFPARHYDRIEKLLIPRHKLDSANEQVRCGLREAASWCSLHQST
jgi:hypothetical protein